MKYIMPAIRFKIFITVLLGLLYPLAMTGVAKTLFPRQASGDFISRGGVVLGSNLIAQSFENPKYFWPRPSAIGYNPLPSGGSNLGQAADALKKTVDERKAKLKAAHPDMGEPPQDLFFASGSGLDPDISPEAATYQISRVAKARKMDAQQVRQLVDKIALGPQFGIFGEATVNVLALNLALDKTQGIDTAPVFVPPPPAPPAATPTGGTQ